MALENVGYMSRGTIDWAGLTNKIAEGINQIGVDQKKAREENQATFDQTNSLLNKPLNLEKQSLNTFVISSSDAAKNQLLEAKRALYNREISSAEYKRIAANMQEHWQNFAEQAKTADERFKLYQERNTPDANGVIAASDAEDFLMEQYLNAADLNNKKMVIGKDGSMYLQQVDPNTGEQVGDLIDYRDFARPENMQINRINLSEAVKNITGNWAAFQEWTDKGRGGEETVESVRLQPRYEEAKINAVNAIINNPKAALSVIVDNGVPGGGMYYMKDTEGDRMIQEEIVKKEAAKGSPLTEDEKKQIRMSAVKFTKNDAGEYVPELTDEQMEFAKGIADRAIDMQMEYSITGSPRQQWSSGGGGGGGGGSKDSVAINAYIASADAVTKGDFAGFDTDNYRFESKKDASGKPYVLIKRVLKDGKGGIFVDQNNPVKVYSPEGMTQYLKNLDGDVPMYFRGKEDYKKLYGDEYYKPGQPAGSGGKPSATTIKASDIPAKAKAAGYTTDEYKKLLQQKGIKII